MQVHIGEQRLQDCERQLQQAHSAAQTLAAEKGDLHAQLAALRQALSEKAALIERIADLEAQVSPSRTIRVGGAWAPDIRKTCNQFQSDASIWVCRKSLSA